MGHGAALGQGRVERQLRQGVFVHRQRFAREQRFIELEVVAAQQAQIRCHHLAALQQHGIAHHQGFGIPQHDLAIAQHQGLHLQQLAQRMATALRFPFLQPAHGGIEQQHRSNKQGIFAVAHRQREQGRQQQHGDEWAGELAHQHSRQSRGRSLGQPIGAVGGQAAFRLYTAEPRGIAGRRQGMPRGGFSRHQARGATQLAQALVSACIAQMAA